MVACNPRDREAAHRAEVEGIGMADRDAVTCKACLKLVGSKHSRRRPKED
jgi:hypothetical protein